MLEMIDAFVRNQDLIPGSRSFLKKFGLFILAGLKFFFLTGIFHDFQEY
jgi:hypothetical protein